jgi:hypothetical protein
VRLTTSERQRHWMMIKPRMMTKIEMKREKKRRKTKIRMRRISKGERSRKAARSLIRDRHDNMTEMRNEQSQSLLLLWALLKMKLRTRK